MHNLSKKRVLLYLGKFPGYGFDVDGGSILARQLIDTLKGKCILDVVFIRKNGEEFCDNSVHEVRYVEYKDAFNNKFIRRLENLDTNVQAIGDYTQYDIIITAHVSKFFGFESAPDTFWKKTILFPMFCTSSYIRAGENVPEEYTEQERFVLSHVSRIICPSEVECNDLKNDYDIDPRKVTVIFRGINPVFTFVRHSLKAKNPNIICVGSIKRQKNNLEALKVLSLIRKSGISAELNLVCTIQDKGIYDDMLQYIKSHELTPYIHFHFGLSQVQVAKLMGEMDINISVSNWETFGRGIFEGISSGLPTFVPTRLASVKKICAGCDGVCFSDTPEEMAEDILSVLSDKNLYSSKVERLGPIVEKVSYRAEQKQLLKAILQE